MVFRTVAPASGGPLEVSWQTNFRPVIPSIALCVSWLFLLCLTLPSRAPSWRWIRLASFPALASIAIPITFNRTYTLGNPLRDLALPTITWTIMCKAVEICLVYSKGGPRPIRPFLPNTSKPVSQMAAANYAKYEWKQVDFPELLSWDRFIYAVDVLFLRRAGTSLILAKQGRALEWSQRGLNQWSRYLKLNKCRPQDIPAHSAVRRFGQPEMPLWTGLLQVLCVWMSFRWLYALAAPTSEMIDLMGFYLPVGSETTRNLWHRILPSRFTQKHLVLLGVPTSVFELPLATRLVMVASAGGAIFLAPGFLEALVLKVWTPTPATCFLASFERPLTSPGLARLWARSWHATSQRDYLNLALVMPFSQNQVLQLLYVFFWSGVQHSWMLSRLRTSPSAKLDLATLTSAMIDPSMITFFLSQGAGILIERAALDALPPSWKKHRTTIAVAKRVWMFSVLLLPGCLFLDSILQKKLMTKDIIDGFSLRSLALMLAGQKYPVSS
ncbi:uncharacterized protein SRS1_12427 [Sporisorium reilianum f. sp. reilianum]|uniref:Wax synthase domain-containing protein n=1 Tax=Sporisorium reilianum f. sp. reilianum TaxID=72559 RepID=A0A2N8U817_9BASI|nr:uncharacterized protein SRS1_12427 [Sporisorium reilianum f. sp. reilianum]